VNSEKSGNLASADFRARVLKWVLIVTLPITAVAVAAVLFPQQVWNDFLYRFFWGPVVSDSQEHTVSGVPEGYNVVSTISYALLLGIGFLGFYRLARFLRLKVDVQLVLASIPIFLFGGLARALEDAQLYQNGLEYLFISPLIYVLMALLFSATIGVALYSERKQKDRSERAKTRTFLALMLILLGAVMVVSNTGFLIVQANPLVPLSLLAIAIGVYLYAIEHGLGRVPAGLLSVGMFFVSLAAAYAALFQVDAIWRSEFVVRSGSLITPHPDELLIILAIACAATFACFLAGKVAKDWRLALLAAPLNLLMFFSHFLDGAATYRGIDFYGYAEKHVVPVFLINWSGTAATLLLFKFLMVLALIVVLDVLFKEDLAKYPYLGNIAKFGVVFLGLAPGVRDMVRISMGV